MPLTNLKSSPYSTANLPHSGIITTTAHRPTNLKPNEPLHTDPPSRPPSHPPSRPPSRPRAPPRSRASVPSPPFVARSNPRFPRTSSHISTAQPPCSRASQPLGALPPCNATLRERRPAGRRSATLQCPTAVPPTRRHRTSCAGGIRAAAGAPSAVAAFSVGCESAASLAVTTSWLLVASWFCPSAPTRPALPSAPPTFATHQATLQAPRYARLRTTHPTPRGGGFSLRHNRSYVKLRKLPLKSAI